MELSARSNRSVTHALAMRGISRTFGETAALRSAQLIVERGTIHALLGENGAGKSTLMRIAFGMIPPDHGTIEIEGTKVRLHNTADAISLGVGMVHQHFMLIPAMTATENVALGGHGIFSREHARRTLLKVSGETGLSVDPDARVSELPIGAQQRLEILKALTHGARTIILDEPTAVLTPSEITELYSWLRRFAHGGGTAVLITHKLAEAVAVASAITILRRGETVLEKRTADTSENEIVDALVGEKGSRAMHADAQELVTDASPERKTIFSLRSVSTARLNDVTLEIREGEILGVIGVEGSGYYELLRVLAGRIPPTRGQVSRPEVVGFVPEDRLNDAMIPSMSLTENIVLANAASLKGLVDWKSAAIKTDLLIKEHDVRTAKPDTQMSSLSGGNQQRLIVARESQLSPHALVVENPTRGLDIRAAARVRTTISDMAKSNRTAVVYYSSDLDEVLSIATRVVACFQGNVREIQQPKDRSDLSPYARALLGVPPLT